MNLRFSSLLKNTFFFAFIFSNVLTFSQTEPTKELNSSESEFENRPTILVKEGKFTLLNPSTKEVFLLPYYEKIVEMAGGFYFITQNKTIGIYNIKSKKIEIEPHYDEIKLIYKIIEGKQSTKKKYYFITKKEDKFGLIDENFKFLLPNNFDKIACDGSLSVSNIIYRKDILKGFIALDEEDIVLEPVFDSIYRQSNSSNFILKHKNKLSLIDSNGKTIIQNILNISLCPAEQFSYGVYQIIENENLKKGLFSIIDNNLIIPCDYDNFSFVNNELIIAEKNQKFGVIDRNLKILIPFAYKKIQICNSKNSEIYFAVKKDKATELIKINSEVVFKSPKEIEIENINNYFTLKDSKSTKIINSKGKVILNQNDITVGAFAEGKCSIFFQDSMWFIDTLGQIIPNSKRKSNGNGFSSLIDLASKFLEVLQSQNDSLLLEFCTKVSFDENSLEYQYRDAKFKPEKPFFNESMVNKMIQNSFKNLTFFREELFKNKKLASLKICQIEPDKIIFSSGENKYEIFFGYLKKTNGFFKVSVPINGIIKLRELIFEY